MKGWVFIKRCISIKENKDFKRLYYKGKSYVAKDFVVYVGKGRKGKIRVGITAGKKIGCAVKRNRAKRLLRVAFDQNRSFIKSGLDFVIVARSKILEEKSGTVSENMRNILKTAGVFSETTDNETFDKDN